MFFESYQNYLQVDIIAVDLDDLRAWKGWVESRLRQLTLMIERDTLGKLQCHPYPHEFNNPSTQCAHASFFTGLQRKQGEIIEENKQFDIRDTVEEFKESIHMYMYWKPGMEIFVSHVRRKQIPLYVFPNGYRPARISRPVNHQPENISRKRKSISPISSPGPSPESCVSFASGTGSEVSSLQEGDKIQPNVEPGRVLNSMSAADLEENTIMRSGVTSTA